MTPFDMQEPRAKKSLGQNFLQDKNIAHKIVDALKIEPSDRLMEIGPGPGMLTRFILEAGPSSLSLVEKDDAMAAAWAKEAAKESLPISVMNMDALKIDWPSYVEPIKIIGNLPYNVASPLIWDIVSLTPGLKRAVFMVQKEVGERLAAAASSSAYGALSIWVQSFTRPRLEFLVPPQVFKPRPKVYSAVVSFEPLPKEEWPEKPEVLSYILKMFFQQRRKQLGGILRSHGYDLEILYTINARAEDRSENLSVEQYKALCKIFLMKQ